MAIEIPRNITVESVKDSKPKKTVELKSPGGAVVGAAIKSARAIPAVRHTAAENRVNQDKKGQENGIAVIGASLVILGPHPLIKIAGAALIFATSCKVTFPNNAPVQTPSSSASVPIDKANYADLPVTQPIESATHELYMIADFKKSQFSNEAVSILIGRKKDKTLVNVYVTFHKTALDKDFNYTDTMLENDRYIPDGTSAGFRIPPTPIKNSKNEVFDLFIDAEGKLNTAISQKESGFKAWNIRSMLAIKVDDLSTINPMIVKESENIGGKKYFIAVDAKLKGVLYTGRKNAGSNSYEVIYKYEQSSN